MGNLSVFDQRLGRNAANVKADTTPILLLNNSNLLAKLGRADGGDVATGARSEYYYIIMFSHAFKDTCLGLSCRARGLQKDQSTLNRGNEKAHDVQIVGLLAKQLLGSEQSEAV